MYWTFLVSGGASLYCTLQAQTDRTDRQICHDEERSYSVCFYESIIILSVMAAFGKIRSVYPHGGLIYCQQRQKKPATWVNRLYRKHQHRLQSYSRKTLSCHLCEIQWTSCFRNVCSSLWKELLSPWLYSLCVGVFVWPGQQLMLTAPAAPVAPQQAYPSYGYPAAGYSAPPAAPAGYPAQPPAYGFSM